MMNRLHHHLHKVPRSTGRTALLVTLLGVLQACATGPVATQVLPTPEPLSPEVNSDILLDTPVRYSWAAEPGATEYEFHLFDRSNGDISRYYLRELDPDDICSDGVCAVEVSASLPLMRSHAWRVRAANRVGWSGWSRREFTMVER